MNAEFQRRARRDKKGFLRGKCKEIEKNNRMGKTRDFYKKIRDIKGTFHANMGSIKDRNGMDLTHIHTYPYNGMIIKIKVIHTSHIVNPFSVVLLVRSLNIHFYQLSSMLYPMLSCFSCVQLFATLGTVALQAPLVPGILQARIL